MDLNAADNHNSKGTGEVTNVFTRLVGGCPPATRQAAVEAAPFPRGKSLSRSKGCDTQLQKQSALILQAVKEALNLGANA